MSNRTRKGKTRGGSSSRYYLPESMPLILCGACLMVVLQSSEKAEGIYRKLVQSYGLPGIEAVSKAADMGLPRRERRAMLRKNLRAMKARRFQGKDEVKPSVSGCHFLQGCEWGDIRSCGQGGNALRIRVGGCRQT